MQINSFCLLARNLFFILPRLIKIKTRVFQGGFELSQLSASVKLE